MTARTNTKLLVATACLAVAAPLLGYHWLQSEIHNKLSKPLSEATGYTVKVDSVTISATGVVELRKLKVGNDLRIGSIKIAIDPFDVLNGHAELQRIDLFEPVATVRVTKRGRTNWHELAQTMTALRKRRRQAARKSTRTVSLQDRLGIHQARIEFILPDNSKLIARDISVGRERSGHGMRLHSSRVGVQIQSHLGQLRMRLASATAVLSPSFTLERLWAHRGHAELAQQSRQWRFRDIGFSYSPSQGRGDFQVVLGNSPVQKMTGTFSRTGSTNSLAVDAVAIPTALFRNIVPRSLGLERGTFTGAVHYDGSTKHSVTVLGRVQDILVDDSGIAESAFSLSADVDAAVAIQRQPSGAVLVELQRARLEHRGIPLLATGNATWSKTTRLEGFTVDLSLPTTPCMKVLRALPEAFHKQLYGLSARGTVSAKLSLAFAKPRPEDTRLETNVDLADCKVYSEPTFANVDKLKKPYRHTFFDGSQRILGTGRLAVNAGRLPRHVVGAWIAAEDARFYEHDGFDTNQLARSLAINLENRAFSRGGSTISQQLTKNIFLSPERSLARKFQEAVLTWRLEHRLSKREILTQYLNIIELGPSVYGIEQAAKYWFDTTASRLSVAQAAFLAALTPAPRTLSRRLVTNKALDKYTAERVHVVLRNMRRRRVISPEQLQRAKERWIKPIIRVQSHAKLSARE